MQGGWEARDKPAPAPDELREVLCEKLLLAGWYFMGQATGEGGRGRPSNALPLRLCVFFGTVGVMLAASSHRARDC